MGQVFQVGGAVLILIAFGLAQVRRLETTALAYILLNLVGSAVLAVDALLGDEWGFLLLEGVWAIISAAALVAKLSGRQPAASH